MADDPFNAYFDTTTKVELRQKQIYGALNIKSDLIGKYKTIIDKKKSVEPAETI